MFYSVKSVADFVYLFILEQGNYSSAQELLPALYSGIILGETQKIIVGDRVQNWVSHWQKKNQKDKKKKISYPLDYCSRSKYYFLKPKQRNFF